MIWTMAGIQAGMLSTCNEGHAPVEILHWRCVQIVHCWNVEMVDANLLHEANHGVNTEHSPATSCLREGAATDLQPSAWWAHLVLACGYKHLELLVKGHHSLDALQASATIACSIHPMQLPSEDFCERCGYLSVSKHSFYLVLEGV